MEPTLKVWVPPPSPPPKINVRKHHSDLDIPTPRRRQKIQRKSRLPKAGRSGTGTKSIRDGSTITSDPTPKDTSHLTNLSDSFNSCSNDGHPEWSAEDPTPGSPRHTGTDDVEITSATRGDTLSDYQYFVEAVFGSECAVYQLSQRLFVVNGWKSTYRTATTHWYHLRKMTVGAEPIMVCMCPSANNQAKPCFHIKFIAEYGEERFPPSPDLPELEDQVFLFSRYQSDQDNVYVNFFSVPSVNNPTIKNRAVVEYRGLDDGSGIWKCNKDPNLVNCPHVTDARHTLQQHLQGDISAQDPRASRKMYYLTPDTRNASNKADEAVSYQLLPPPIWARIPSDPVPPTITPLSCAPDLIPFLPQTSTCFCRPDRPRYNPFLELERRPCLIYGLTGVWQSTIEVQKCYECKHRYIGPDCRELGLFNFNNRILVTHQLLEDYLSTFTASETPIRAWVNVMTRRYESLGSLPFLKHEMFGSVWFAYARLLQLEGDMACNICGPDPDVLIFDGVSLSFNQKNLRSSLEPPTIIHPTQSSVRDKTVRLRKLQFIHDADTRKGLRKILEGPSLSCTDFSSIDREVSLQTQDVGLDDEELESGSSDEEDVRARNDSRRKILVKKQQRGLLQRFQLLPQIVQKLSSINGPLGTLFERIFGVASVLAKKSVPAVYRELFIQLNAEESALQMLTYSSIQSLKRFIERKDRESQSNLIHIPSLFNVLDYEFAIHGEILPDTLGVCSWIYLRAETVRRMLLVHKTDEPNPALGEASNNWQKTGCCYSKPRVRLRPAYPNLHEDKQREKGVENKGGCRKYFTKYSPRKLTGGIMVPWCTHSVAYGFHCIPVSEGRNDVFSAIYTRWEKAPKVVIYDFACALQPYCMLREPEFFQDTLFVIDKFHAPDHTKCCPSSFLSTYERTDSRFVRVNSSAGECGNGGLGRIRKSVSYMSQDRAVLFTKTFLSIWNRLRILGHSI